MTAKRRASDASAAFGRALKPAPVVPAPAPAPEPSVRHSEPNGGREDGKPKPSKYTLLLDQGPAADFDDLASRLRRKLGRRVDKAEIIRAWIDLTADEPTLFNDLANEIQRRS